jgi:hypothetical protein
MNKELLLPIDVLSHKDRNYTWSLSDDEIEDKIKKLRKDIYTLQNCRKKQPLLVVFRKDGFGEGEMKCHIFHGFQIRDDKNRLFCADYWKGITENEFEQLSKKYKLTKLSIKIIKKTIQETKNGNKHKQNKKN